MSSITSSVSNWSKSHETGCVRLVRRLVEDASGENDVIFTIFRNVSDYVVS